MLVAQGISKHYGNMQVLQGINLTIATGEIVAITGASGAGKSTLLHVLATLERPDGGSIYLEDIDVLALRGDALASFRNHTMGFVFQLYNLLPEFTTLENVCMPAYLAGKSGKEVTQRAQELLALLGLKERSQHKPAALSGGEQQRVAVARALMNRPKVIFADEPSGNLDAENAALLHTLFFELRAQLGQTFVLATHNPQLAEMADRMVVLQNGTLYTGS